MTPTPFDDYPPHKAVAVTMARFTFTKPIEAADLDYVRAELEGAAPGCRATVTLVWAGAAVRVDVVEADGQHLFGRMYVAI